MDGKFRTLTLPKAEAAALYRKDALKHRHAPALPEALPNAIEINGWRQATAAEAERRANEIAFGTEEAVSVEMIYDYPRDIINYCNRLAGEPAE